MSSHTHLIAILFSTSRPFGLLSPGFWLFLYLSSNFSLRLEVCCLEPKEAVCCPHQPQKVGLCTPMLVTNSSLDRRRLISRPHPVAVQMGMNCLFHVTFLLQLPFTRRQDEAEITHQPFLADEDTRNGIQTSPLINAITLN